MITSKSGERGSYGLLSFKGKRFLARKRAAANRPGAVGATPPTTTPGLRNALRNIYAKFPTGKTPPIAPSTAAGSEIVQLPTPVAPPPNSTAAVEQAVTGSTQLYENTITNAGTGAGRISPPVTLAVKPPKTAVIILALLGGGLLLAFAYDRGKL